MRARLGRRNHAEIRIAQRVPRDIEVGVIDHVEQLAASSVIQRSLILKLFDSGRSTFSHAGPRSADRGELPKLYADAVWNAAVLNQWFSDCAPAVGSPI